MGSKKKRYSLIISVLILLSMMLPAPHAAAQHGAWCACGSHSTVPTSFEIDHTSATWRSAASTSFARWDAYADMFSWSTGDGAAGPNDKNEIIWFTAATANSVYGFNIDNDTFGVTYINPQSAFGSPSFNACPPPAGTTCGNFSETDVIMNSSFTRGWTTSPPNFSDTGPANYYATAIHELGHTIGRHHHWDQLTTMNYYEDFATIYLSHSDGRSARGIFPSKARTVTDVATYPFRFSGSGYSGTTVASPNPSSVQQGQTFSLRNFTIENIGSTTPSDVELRIYLSTNTTISTADYQVGSLHWSSFATWWDSTGTNFSVPLSVPAGTYYIGAIAFYNTSSQDGITYNNTWALDSSRRLTVTAAPTTVSTTILSTIPTISTTVFTTIPTISTTIPTISTTIFTTIPTISTTIFTTIPTISTTVFTTIPTISTTIFTTIPTISTTIFTTIPTISTTVFTTVPPSPGLPLLLLNPDL